VGKQETHFGQEGLWLDIFTLDDQTATQKWVPGIFLWGKGSRCMGL